MRLFALTPAARSDLEAILNYLAEKSSDAPGRVSDELRKAMRRLAEAPHIGHLRTDLADEPLRFWTVYSYLIVYRPETNPLQIVRILHGARDVKAILGHP